MSTQIVTNIISCLETEFLLEARGLKAYSITWEDTGRDKWSSVGPNISDMSLIVKDNKQLTPVIRNPNFSDVTYDVPIENFRLKVGNEEEGAETKTISLKDYISNIGKYNQKLVDAESLFDKRDSHILTNSQCCVLPVTKGTKTEFAVQLFNYQGFTGNPAVLVIVVSKEGTSTTVLTDSKQRLYFNNKGKSHWFSVERLEDVRERKGDRNTKVNSYKEMKDEEKTDNTLMVIQIPLVQTARKQEVIKMFCMDISYNGGCEEQDCDEQDHEIYFAPQKLKKKSKNGMDMGQITLGSCEGDYYSGEKYKLVRDSRFPIRCTFQSYRVTDEDFISSKDVIDISNQINEVAKMAVASGSLVVEEKGNRMTEWV